ncbi:hypothetical protein M569_04330 [Genlisea aurea]|uniref:Glycosyl transferase family 1 domain-containing protein n=1 Tax=Genlisea aurea TaxID=192259 RepID=S8CZC6_9LAMI|nr:hypothetical protein M569_04330 [Genlisea aurea]
MGSLESGVSIQRELRSSFGKHSSGSGSSSLGVLGQRNRSRTVCGFFARIEDGRNLRRIPNIFKKIAVGDLSLLKELDFGEDVSFEPVNLLAKFQKHSNESKGSYVSFNIVRYGYRKPKLALAFADLRVDSHHILMLTLAAALQSIGYEIEVLSLEDGPGNAVWREVGFPIRVIEAAQNLMFPVDWLNFNGVLVNSVKAVDAVYSLMQDPFRDVPLVWTIHEHELALRFRDYVSNGQVNLFDNWKKFFARASVVVFPNHILPMAYSACDPGNYFVIPGSSMEAWEVGEVTKDKKDNTSAVGKDFETFFVVAIVGSSLVYKGRWLEHALVLKALHPFLRSFSGSGTHLKIVILTGSSTPDYSSVVETIVENLKYPNGTVEHVVGDENVDDILRRSDVVLYGSFLEEHTFPEILRRAMHLEKPVVAPDLSVIRNCVADRKNGFLFRKEDVRHLADLMSRLIFEGSLSKSARDVAAVGTVTVRTCMVAESVERYASLLENVLVLPSEVAVPCAAKDIPEKLKTEWRWRDFKPVLDDASPPEGYDGILDEVEKRFNHSLKENDAIPSGMNDSFLYSIWEEQKLVDSAYLRKKREDEELKDRTDQPRGTWDEVYRNARRPDRSLHERDEGELERTGQPLCIYEPYNGRGTWPFLHNSSSLYRGIAMSVRGRRPGADDVDAPSRLPLLNDAYYRDALGEYGAFFAIANRVDRIHKNPWIGFHSWRATARTVTLSPAAEKSLVNAVETKKHGDALYFWFRLDRDERHHRRGGQDFWSFCDAVNSGNCRLAFRETLKKMYGMKEVNNSTSVPSMPSENGTWSAMHCWALPTRSFLEFVMFSRMFVNALLDQEEHRKTGRCYLSPFKEKHCYSRLLELLVNVWAYHSGRVMVYVDPETGKTEEQHGMGSRRGGKMWLKWFHISTLKRMDEDLAEEWDDDDDDDNGGGGMWGWSGEIMWDGIYEKEKEMRSKEKQKKKQKTKEKIHRMRAKSHQKALGKYIKPPPSSDANR